MFTTVSGLRNTHALTVSPAPCYMINIVIIFNSQDPEKYVFLPPFLRKGLKKLSYKFKVSQVV